ncbi:hypothetical protein [Latilactobacillus fragifolii]|uniref:hypothetical protein n=1 Tax=Latilactobacillus fragifolii TaxID=2814244 RepID=UPI001ABBD0FF|nr:hypothetical protein [Latilactobacillus fragifolii]
MCRINWLLFFLIIGVTSTGTVQAAPGELNVNNQVIERNDVGNQQQANTAYRTMPDMFLNDRNRTVKQQQTDKQRIIQNAQHQVFSQTRTTKDHSLQKSVGQKISFNKSRTSTQSGSGTKNQEGVPGWIKYSLIGVVLILASLSGVYLGKRYAKIFKRGRNNG